ncbi:TetR/AcrR family transcriptional regulator [Hyphomonas sp.]|uniref:TetR/AcrR family transcriptional regulator n=1 Tax=Hyphomonas sp. TaxID=87 RepID=UPI00391B632E
MRRRAGETRDALMEAAFDLVRRQGLAATSVDEICAAAGVSKGAFFHHFKSKEDLAASAANHWSATTGAMFAAAPYHAAADPLDRVLGYIDFRARLIEGAPEAFTCFAGTMVQEAHATNPPVRAACWDSISGHADQLVGDIEAAVAAHGKTPGWTARGLALHTQAVLQGAFILAKASGEAELARESIGHLKRYVELLFGRGDRS